MGNSSDLTFEQAIMRLEIVVQKLDSGELSLDDALGMFEEGVKLASECSKQLTDAQGRLERLTKASGGSLHTEQFAV